MHKMATVFKINFGAAMNKMKTIQEREQIVMRQR